MSVVNLLVCVGVKQKLSQWQEKECRGAGKVFVTYLNFG